MGSRCLSWFVAFVAVACTASSTHAQVGGVYIDAKGMLRRTATLSADERLNVLRTAAVGKPGTRQLAAGSSLRMVSLKRLERIVREHHSTGKPLPPDVRFLAGLTRVQFVFFNPQEHDVIIAGPAEGWKPSPTGEVVGVKSGRPVLHLDDLVVALRYTFTEKERAAFVGCSIEPTPDGEKRHAVYMRNLRGRFNRNRLRSVLAGMESAMGPQAVKMYGVDPSSRFALTMLAADYRLKCIGMAHEKAPVRGVVSYLDLVAKRRTTPRQPQHRWWFLAGYDSIEHTADRLAFEFKGTGVKVATARAIAGEQSSKQKTKPRKASRSAEQFAQRFSRHYSALAKQIPVFAELQNLIGLSVAAELAAQRYYGEAADGEVVHWKPTHFLNAKACPVEKYTVPSQVPSLANARLIGGRHWLFSVSGGVEINPTAIAGKATLKPARGNGLVNTRSTARLPKSPQTWWWD